MFYLEWWLFSVYLLFISLPILVYPSSMYYVSWWNNFLLSNFLSFFLSFFHLIPFCSSYHIECFFSIWIWSCYFQLHIIFPMVKLSGKIGKNRETRRKTKRKSSLMHLHGNIYQTHHGNKCVQLFILSGHLSPSISFSLSFLLSPLTCFVTHSLTHSHISRWYVFHCEWMYVPAVGSVLLCCWLLICEFKMEKKKKKKFLFFYFSFSFFLRSQFNSILPINKQKQQQEREN